MPTYQVTYLDTKQTLIDSEAIFMKNLVTAKRSAEHHAPSNAEQIIIQDLMDKVLSRLIVNEGWTDTPSN
ncbi:hypothetical protein K6U44_01815 [Vibrio parahaemolyticus]|uniref:hypothetical protein n=1 Tax=Vibrio parahaemolyticus TaxID=670 RepID=UPI001EECDCAD|nr:hypothetical protein [Vibrio parahaemolyticus]MCG6459218.1 hypothetical protein [Vibrio parahaemolyticus]MDG2632966.1 hypothetical protein [Vibrio parahaemolyticus]